MFASRALGPKVCVTTLSLNCHFKILISNDSDIQRHCGLQYLQTNWKGDTVQPRMVLDKNQCTLKFSLSCSSPSSPQDSLWLFVPQVVTHLVLLCPVPLVCGGFSMLGRSPGNQGCSSPWWPFWENTATYPHKAKKGEGIRNQHGGPKRREE